MTSAIGFLVVGALMLAMGLLAPAMRRLPLTTAIIYLAVGMIVGPTVLGLFHFNPLRQSALLEVLTEAAVLVSLFAAGVKLPAPVTWARWRSPLRSCTSGQRCWAWSSCFLISPVSVIV
jgi:Kef-type K+ transport system membrane component KefB